MPGLKWTHLARTAKRLVDQHGGVDALKQDADELKKIAKSEGSLGTKAGTAVATLKRRAAAPADEQAPASDQPPAAQPAAASDQPPAASDQPAAGDS